MKKTLFTSALLLSPMFALAQGTGVQTGNIRAFVTQLGEIIALLLPILVTLAVVLFFWGLAVFIFSAGSDEGREKGKQIMIWGVIALFIIVSVWGIIAFLGNLLGINQGGTAPTPGVGNVGGIGINGTGGAPGGGGNPGGGVGPAGNGGGNQPPSLPNLPVPPSF